MRKVLSFVLVLSLILGSFSFAFGVGATSDFPDVADTDAEGPVAVLSALGVINGYPDGTFKPDKVVTRAEMAKLTVMALGMESYVAGMTSSFPDTAGHWATSYIAWCASYGIVQGYPDGTFKPGNTVTLQQATTMIVRALGYQDRYLTGTWPTSHISMAMSLDILKDIVATTDGATRGDVARMLYNALPCKLINYDTSGNLTATDDSMLKRLGAYEFEQVVQRDDIMDAAIDVSEYLGAYAKFWAINEDKDNDTGIYDETKNLSTKYECIVAIEEQVSTFLTGDFNYSKEEFKVGGKTYTLRADVRDDINEYFYNGSTVVGSASGAIDPQEEWEGAPNTATTAPSTGSEIKKFTIAAKVSGNYITNIYSVLLWDATLEVQWDNDYASEVEDDQAIDGNEFVLDDDDEIDMVAFALRGADTLDAISTDDVATVYVSNEDEITRVEVGTETVDGAIDEEDTENDVYTIAGTDYDKSAKSDTSFTAGDEGTFYLNWKGEIAFFDKDSGLSGNYAIILTRADWDSGYASSAGKVQLLTKDDEQSVFEFNKKATAEEFIGFASNATATSTPALGAYNPDNAAGLPVTISTTSGGKLKDAEGVTLEDAGGKLSKDRKTLNGNKISSDVVVFVAPYSASASEVGDKDDYYVASLSDLSTDDTFGDITGTSKAQVQYAMSDDGKTIDLIVIRDDNLVGTSNIGFITGWSNSTDSDGGKIYTLKTIINGTAKSYKTDDRKPGDFDTTDDYLGILYTFKFSGDVITEANYADVKQVESFVDTFAGDANMYAPASRIAASGDAEALGDFYAFKVTARDGDLINVADGGTNAYQTITGAKIYKATLKDDAFNGFATGGSIAKGDYVVFLQTDKDSDNWDLVLVVKAKDWNDVKGTF